MNFLANHFKNIVKMFNVNSKKEPEMNEVHAQWLCSNHNTGLANRLIEEWLA